MAIMPKPLGVLPGLRSQRHGRHVGQRHQIARQPVDDVQRALHGRDRLERIKVAEPGSRAMRSLRRALCVIVQEPSGNSPVSMP